MKLYQPLKETLESDAMRGNKESPPESYDLVRRQGGGEVDEAERAFQRFPKGSILIWVLAISMMLTTLFLFFGSRLKKNAELQEESIAYRNQKNYVESYAGYLEKLKTPLTKADFDDIKGTFTNQTLAIEGFLDSEKMSPTYTINALTRVEWNRCDLGQKGDLMIQETGTPNYHTPSCLPGSPGYDDVISVDPMQTNNKLTLVALSAPLHYRITDLAGGPLTGIDLYLDLSIPVGRESIEVKKVIP